MIKRPLLWRMPVSPSLWCRCHWRIRASTTCEEVCMFVCGPWRGGKTVVREGQGGDGLGPYFGHMQKGGNGKGGIRSCLPVHCLSAPSDRQPYCHTNATSSRSLLVEGHPNCARQSLASTLSAPRVSATSYCDPGRHASVVTPCLVNPLRKRGQLLFSASCAHAASSCQLRYSGIVRLRWRNSVLRMLAGLVSWYRGSQLQTPNLSFFFKWKWHKVTRQWLVLVNLRHMLKPCAAGLLPPPLLPS